MTVETYDRALELAQHAERGALGAAGEAFRALIAGVEETQTVGAGDTITIPKALFKRVRLSCSGAGALTALAAPGAAGVGKFLSITAFEGTDAVTMALTNIQGGSAASSASFNAALETLGLYGVDETKWQVIWETGVTLS